MNEAVRILIAEDRTGLGRGRVLKQPMTVEALVLDSQAHAHGFDRNRVSNVVEQLGLEPTSAVSMQTLQKIFGRLEQYLSPTDGIGSHFLQNEIVALESYFKTLTESKFSPHQLQRAVAKALKR